ncbi:MAG: C40 family peptidase [Gemmatimonadaceae bacterium]
MCAASQTATANRQPFAAMSASAQRLKDSVAARIERLATRVEVHDSTVLGVPEQILRDSVVAVARKQIGRRYVFGGTTPRGFDCSGLVRFVLAALRFGVPRTAAEQAWTGLAVTPDTSALRPGDIVTFGSTLRAHHVGIYSGDGKFIHASVKAGRVIESSITRQTSPLIRKWSGARSLLALGDSIPG